MFTAGIPVNRDRMKSVPRSSIPAHQPAGRDGLGAFELPMRNSIGRPHKIANQAAPLGCIAMTACLATLEYQH